MESKLSVRVYLEDTDAGQIVYHANYLKFMERARTEFLREVGMEQSTTLQQEFSFVVHSMDMQFKSPAKLDDTLDVRCALKTASGASVVFEQVVSNADTGTEHCRATVTVACIGGSNLRPRRIPRDTMRRLKGAD